MTLGGANGFGDEQDRPQACQLAQQVQAVTDHTVEIAFVDQGYTGEQAPEAALQHGIRLEVVKLPDAKLGFSSYLVGGWSERSFAWIARFRRLPVIMCA